MKKLNTLRFIILTLIISGTLGSCNTRKIGFFHNNYSQYSVKGTNTDNPDAVVASTNTEIQALPAPRIIKIKKEDAKITKETATEIPAVILTEALPASTKKASKEKRKEIKKSIKENLKQNKKSATEINTLLLVIIAILLPPVAVALVDGITGPFWLSLLLTLLFYVPGLIYALYRIFRKQD